MKKTPVPPRRGRRSQDGGVVTEKLHGLMEEVRREAEPGQLRELACSLSAVLDQKSVSNEDAGLDQRQKRKA